MSGGEPNAQSSPRPCARALASPGLVFLGAFALCFATLLAVYMLRYGELGPYAAGAFCVVSLLIALMARLSFLRRRSAEARRSSLNKMLEARRGELGGRR